MNTTSCLSMPTAERAEVGVDDVLAVAEAFAEGVLERDVSNECYAEQKNAYVHVFMGGYPADGFTDDYALARADEIGETIASMGWFVAKAEIVVATDSPGREVAIEDGDADDDDDDEEPQTMLFIDLFPRNGPMSHAATHERFFWHASPASNRESILKNGIRPGRCGNDFIVLPEDRLYVCTNAMFLESVELDMSRSRRWHDLDVWRIDLSAIPEHEWRDDVEMEEISAWTRRQVPPETITLAGKLENMHMGGWTRLLPGNTTHTTAP